MTDNDIKYDPSFAQIARLVPNKPDAELAQELKAEAIEAWGPILKFMEKAHKLNFRVVVNAGINELGHAFIHNMEIMRMYK